MIENITVTPTTTITPIEEFKDQFNECLLDLIDLSSNTQTLDSELDIYLRTSVYYNPSDSILKFFLRLYVISKQ
jgi:hypothetical protein